MFRPLTLVLAGIVVVALDLEFDDFDFLWDPAGWLMVLIGVVRLRSRNPWFDLAVVASALGLVVAIPASLATRPGWLLTNAELVLQTGVVFGICSALGELLRHRPREVRAANLIRWADLASTAVLVALSPLTDDDTVPPLLALGLLAVLVGIAAGVWFLVLLVQVRADPALELRPPPPEEAP